MMPADLSKTTRWLLTDDAPGSEDAAAERSLQSAARHDGVVVWHFTTRDDLDHVGVGARSARSLSAPAAAGSLE